MDPIICELCESEVTCERSPIGFALICSNNECANHKADRFWLNEQAAQRHWKEGRKSN